ncbi:MAG: hypothetical protein H6757_06355 [Candidatus Omnitrophica bacterium]|nr:hypothetical protein [Candidatus Omnitrophota bacterium]
MNLKKLGQAEYDIVKGTWFVPGRKNAYLTNPRLVETQPQVKSARAVYSKFASKRPPSFKKPTRRKEFEQTRTDYKQVYDEALREAYESVRQESFLYPIPLRKDRDFEYARQWLYCLYENEIYELDKAGYTDEEIVAYIRQKRESGQWTKRN